MIIAISRRRTPPGRLNPEVLRIGAAIFMCRGECSLRILIGDGANICNRIAKTRFIMVDATMNFASGRARTPDLCQLPRCAKAEWDAGGEFMGSDPLFHDYVRPSPSLRCVILSLPADSAATLSCSLDAHPGMPKWDELRETVGLEAQYAGIRALVEGLRKLNLHNDRRLCVNPA